MDEIVFTQQLDHRKAIMRMLPEMVAANIYLIPDEYLTFDANELETLTPNRRFTMTDNKLRISFWREHSRAIAQCCNMNISNVVRGVCSRAFFTRFMNDKARMAYMILPPDDYEIAMEEFTGYGIDKLREAFDEALKSFKTDKDPKMYESIRKTVEMLIVHTKGEPIRRVENKNLNMNVDASKAVGASSASTIEEIDAKLKALEIEVGERPMIAGPTEET